MVHHHATTLVSELHYFRRKPNERHRPIIFVCHSLGGIVVKRALIYSSTCNISHNPELRSIKVSTYGIIFLGTPHMGANLARWGKMAEMLVRMVTTKSWVDSNDALIHALGTNSETLQNITDSFVGLSTQFRMFFFWEELKTHIPGMTRDVIVEYASAVPEALPDAGRAGIHATHSDMCKFADENSPGWNVLAGVLCDYVEQAPQVVAGKWQQMFQQEHLDIDWRIRGTIHGRRTPSPSMGTIEMGHGPFGAIEGGQPQQPQRLIGADDAPKLLPAPTPFIKPPTLQENKFFVGREKELETIDKILKDPSKRTVLISSITGGGKTHLAREYFFTHREDFPGGLFWIDCRAPTTGMLSTDFIDYWYSSIAEKLRLEPLTTAGDTTQKRLNDVITWFSHNSDWLLVLDGVDIDQDSQTSTIAKYIPSTASGSVILTSINATLAGSARLGSPHLLALDPPSLDEAVSMLDHYSHIPNGTPSAAYTDLCRALTCLPLAIHAAASYIKDKQLPVSEYLRKHQKHPFVEPNHLPPFHVVFDRFETAYSQAAGLIRVLSFWGQGEGGGVPVELIWWGVRALSHRERSSLVAKEGVRRGADVDVSIGQCLRFAIVERGLEIGVDGVSGVDTLRLHPIARAVCVMRMRSADQLGKWCDLAVEVFCNSFEHLEARRREHTPSEEGKRADGIEFLVSDYARYLTHGTYIQDCIRRYKLGTSQRLVSVLSQIQRLAHPEAVEEGKERISMFIRSGSGSTTSGPEADTPVDDEVEMWFPVMESPVSERRHSIDREHQLEIAERERQVKENVNNMEFQFRYEPPKGPRKGTGRSSGSRRGRGRSATTDFGNPQFNRFGSGRGRTSTGFSTNTANTSSPYIGRDRGRSPTPVPVAYPPPPPPGSHYNPYNTRGAGPYLGRYHHQELHQYPSSAPALIGRIPGLPSPAYTPAYPFRPPQIMMPPYPISPSAELQDPLNTRPFTPGFRATRDVTNSPVLRSIAGVYNRPSSTTPSEAWSEPITRSRSQSPIFAMDGVGTPAPGRRTVPGVFARPSPYSPPPIPAHGLGIDIPGGVSLNGGGNGGGGGTGFLQPGSRVRPRSTSALRRSSVPAHEIVEGASEEMSRTRSEPGVPQAARAVRAELWQDGVAEKEKED
ncbi:hypothetical protein K440DRAFT_614045 [Wilcoxina mikolae CBS 423.85]|nr:hypothetical protein K440DRAFT_614045 [Wilcoxina mikolae CBS 423.85]